jgi:tetraacyldisaccharide 4'-kinase
MSLIERLWYRPTVFPALWLLFPLSLLYRALSHYRRVRLTKSSEPYDCPVLVVGNITVGGTGKTPFIQYLVSLCQKQGIRVGVVSRGYGGHSNRYPLRLTDEVHVNQSGDEPMLIYQTTDVPLVVDPDRNRAVKFLLNEEQLDLIISDDGLQHYGMHRDLELVMVDGQRGFGNRQLLPAGPLRESTTRLNSVDWLVEKDTGNSINYNSPRKADAKLLFGSQLPIKTVDGELVANEVLQPCRIHVVTGIANPIAFYNQLHRLGFSLETHPYPDHYQYTVSDLEQLNDKPVVMTEKDWIKCRSFDLDNLWVVPLKAVLEPKCEQQLLTMIKDKINQH